MLLEETPSGNLRMYSPTDAEVSVRFTRADVHVIANLFELLDRWAQETSGTAARDAREAS